MFCVGGNVAIFVIFKLLIFFLQDREQGRRADKVAVKKGVLLLKLLKLNLVARIFSPASSDKDKEKEKKDRD